MRMRMEKEKQNKYIGQFVEVVIEDIDNSTGKKRGIVKRGFLEDIDDLMLYLKTEREGTLIFPWERVLKIMPPILSKEEAKKLIDDFK